MVSRPSSFRLSETTTRLLDALSGRSAESRNALADRLLGEALRTADHPLISFRAGSSGRRQAAVVGTRLYVHQVVATVRAHDGSLADAAEYLGISESHVRDSVGYYADFQDEVDADAQFAQTIAEDARARWERQRQALA